MTHNHPFFRTTQ